MRCRANTFSATAEVIFRKLSKIALKIAGLKPWLPEASVRWTNPSWLHKNPNFRSLNPGYFRFKPFLAWIHDVKNHHFQRLFGSTLRSQPRRWTSDSWAPAFPRSRKHCAGQGYSGCGEASNREGTEEGDRSSTNPTVRNDFVMLYFEIGRRRHAMFVASKYISMKNQHLQT